MKGATCHASNDCRCFDDVFRLHILCSNNPSFSAASSYKCNVSRPMCTITRTILGVQDLQHVGSGYPIWFEWSFCIFWKLISPAWVISHFNNLLFKGLVLFAWFIIQPLKVNHSVSLFMASTNAMCPNLSWVAHIEKWSKIKQHWYIKIYILLDVLSYSKQMLYYLLKCSKNANAHFFKCKKHWNPHHDIHDSELSTCVISASSLLHTNGSDGVLLSLLPMCPILSHRGCGEKTPALSKYTGDQWSYCRPCKHLRSQKAGETVN